MIKSLSTSESGIGFEAICKNLPNSSITFFSGLYHLNPIVIAVPPELDMVLDRQTEKGYRVIAIGYRTFPAIDIIKLKRLQRDDVECNLIFAGLIIFENKLKPQTTSIISDLRQARMKIVMLTGW